MTVLAPNAGSDWPLSGDGPHCHQQRGDDTLDEHRARRDVFGPPGQRMAFVRHKIDDGFHARIQQFRRHDAADGHGKQRPADGIHPQQRGAARDDGRGRQMDAHVSLRPQGVEEAGRPVPDAVQQRAAPLAAPTGGGFHGPSGSRTAPICCKRVSSAARMRRRDSSSP